MYFPHLARIWVQPFGIGFWIWIFTTWWNNHVLCIPKKKKKKPLSEYEYDKEKLVIINFNIFFNCLQSSVALKIDPPWNNLIWIINWFPHKLNDLLVFWGQMYASTWSHEPPCPHYIISSGCATFVHVCSLFPSLLYLLCPFWFSRDFLWIWSFLFFSFFYFSFGKIPHSFQSATST